MSVESCGRAELFPCLIKSCTPCCDGICPVSMDALAGEHTGDVQKKLVKRIPDEANLSRWGVFISVLPAHPIAHAP